MLCLSSVWASRAAQSPPVLPAHFSLSLSVFQVELAARKTYLSGGEGKEQANGCGVAGSKGRGTRVDAGPQAQARRPQPPSSAHSCCAGMHIDKALAWQTSGLRPDGSRGAYLYSFVLTGSRQ